MAYFPLIFLKFKWEMGQIFAAFSEYLNFNNIASMPSTHLLLFFEFNAFHFNAWLDIFYKSNEHKCLLKKTSEFRVLITLVSCTWYEYLWTYGSGKTFLLTQTHSLSYWFLKFMLTKELGIRLICRIFFVFYLKKWKAFNWKLKSKYLSYTKYVQKIDQSAMQEKICS